MSPERSQSPEWLDAYLDGSMSPARGAEVEHLLSADAALREQVESERRLQARIDGGLRRAVGYAEPSGGVQGRIAAARGGAERNVTTAANDRTIAGRIGGSPARSAGTTASLRRWFALAAVLVLAAAGTWAAYVNFSQPPLRPDMSPSKVYAKLVDHGFTPEFVCTTDESFAATVRERFGQAVLVSATPAVELVGWAYGDNYEGRVVGNKTLILMVKVKGKEVVVLIDRKSEDRPLALDVNPPEAAQGLTLHRAEVNRLVVYEITPLDRPEVIGRMHEPIVGPLR